MNSEKLPITVMIPTLNAEGHLMELLDSIKPYVEDIFIVDSFSIDKTVDIALERGIKIVQRHYVTSSDQFGWMLTKLPVTTPWMFFMAQDERFSTSLVEELHELFAKGIPDGVDGYTVRWRLWFMGRPTHAIVDNLRLLRTARCHVTNVACNEHFVVEGQELRLKGILEHKDTLTMHEWFEKQNLYSTREAIGRVNPPSQDEVPRFWGGTPLQRKAFFKECILRFPIAGLFLQCLYYFFKFGAWRDGFFGWQWARLQTWVWEVTLIKEKEMRRQGIPKKMPEGRHGDVDPRIMRSELQKRLLPGFVTAWVETRRKGL